MKKLLIIILILSVKYLLAQNYYYKNYNVDNGLSQNNVTCILQDHLGFMWFGTDDGLNKFDGYSFFVYRRESNNKNSIGNNSVTSLIEDNYKNIWVGTQNGLYKYVRQENKFVRIKLPSVISQDNVISKMSIYGDNLWVGTANSSIHNVNVKNNTITTYLTVDDKGNVVVNNHIYSLYAFNEDYVFVGTKYTGLNIIFPKKNQIIHKKIHNEKTGIQETINFVATITKLSERSIIINTDSNYPLVVDVKTFKSSLLIEPNYLDKYRVGYSLDFVRDNENVLIGSNGSYLISYNLSTKKIKEYKDNLGKVKWFNVVNDVFIDSESCYWIATSGTGVFYYNPQVKQFVTLNYLEDQKKGLRFSSIRTLYQSKSDEIWVGGYGGLTKLNTKTLEVKDFAKLAINIGEPNKKYKFIPSENIYNITPDFYEPNRYFWVGTEGQGLFKFDQIKEEFTALVYSDKYGRDIDGELQVFATVFDKNGNMYVGTSAGLIRFSENYTKVTKFKHDAFDIKSIQPGRIRTLLVDSDNILWIGSDIAGLSYYNEDENRFVKFPIDNENHNSLSNARINDIFEDSKGRLWIGTWGGGLNLLNKESGVFTSFSTKDGLPNDVIYCILEDDENNLWLSTNLGLTRFDFQKKSFVNFDVNDGLQANEFNKNASFKGKDGVLYFGGVKGITYFNPKGILNNRIKPNVVLTSFKIFNKPSLSNRDINLIKEIEILSEDIVFSFEFAGLSYYQPYKNRYRYRLVGFSNDWIDLGTKRDITFTSLEPDTYYLEIIASNNDGVWNEKPFVLKLVVIPPFYKSWAFLTLVFFISGGMIVGFVYFKIHENRKKKEILENLVNQKTNELLKSNSDLLQEINKEKALIEQLEKAKAEAEKADKAKSLFLANMSHEIRTPMNSVIGFAELLKLNIKDSKLLNYVNSIIGSGKVLLALIDDILDLSRIESGLFKLHYDFIDVNDFFNYVVNTFESETKEKGLYLKVNKSGVENILINTDPVRLKQILHNLVSNAVKFTDYGGITVNFEGRILENGIMDIEICVTDTGIGISEQVKNKIFDNFYQTDGHSTRKYSGTGLGLSITKNLTYLLNGTISLESEAEKGSTFIVRFSNISFKEKTKEPSFEIDNNIDFDEIKFNNQLVLIVDDTEINRKLIKAYLAGNDLRTIETNNGEDAVKMIKEDKPDIVFMDLRMPVMDGYEACEKIKKDENLKHIPIIALTAANIDEDEPFIKESGFDGYLIKPIHRERLIAEIYKYVNTVRTPANNGSRKKLKDDFKEKVNIDELRKKEIKDLIFILRTAYLPKISGLLNTMIINQIEQFANDIENFSVKNNIELINAWANNLINYLNNFDLAAIIRTLNDFGNVIDELEEEIK